ncbi:MAG: HPP family protein [Gammaproteobacteria bacterium]|nr:HPP family protein [Gammaproteobacteria bacterium]
MNFSGFLDLIGFRRHKINYREQLISAVGGFLGIFGILMVSYWLLDPVVAILIVPSMGASAVLLFAAPHAPLSQPWNLVAGHAFSALVGVACWKMIPDYTIAASASVGLAIGVMYMTRSIHPPGGATALAAVIGSEKLHNLGYMYEVQPILLNAITILIVAVVFNNLFNWRRYPVHLHTNKQAVEPVPIEVAMGYEPINHEDFVYALSHIDTLVDIDEDDLLTIYKLATKRHLAESDSSDKTSK